MTGCRVNGCHDSARDNIVVELSPGRGQPILEAALLLCPAHLDWLNRFRTGRVSYPRRGDYPDDEGLPPTRKHDGATLIAQERARHLYAEGWTDVHDDRYEDHELTDAAACYILSSKVVDHVLRPPQGWPWGESWWKPTTEVRDLVKAGALIAAEIDRLQREDDHRG